MYLCFALHFFFRFYFFLCFYCFFLPFSFNASSFLNKWVSSHVNMRLYIDVIFLCYYSLDRLKLCIRHHERITFSLTFLYLIMLIKAHAIALCEPWLELYRCKNSKRYNQSLCVKLLSAQSTLLFYHIQYSSLQSLHPCLRILPPSFQKDASSFFFFVFFWLFFCIFLRLLLCIFCPKLIFCASYVFAFSCKYVQKQIHFSYTLHRNYQTLY